ncbi:MULTISPECIES: polysaccharide biosynthesis/export family protein [Mangrovimonas]|uniref:polysaccharide biosynthesis/export family protein n=1 Tax=Mangrovimonas TaxID=1211036 RepID=UPI0006B49CF1|nr:MULTISPECIES: polysaccharide biosynthesis/export family protein [Mangrovimonas]OMP30675.1 sugar transporter [Mangrovimonas sp. DI 80]
MNITIFNFQTNKIKTLLIASSIVVSCASRKDFVYFQDEPLQKKDISLVNTDLVYSTDDLLTIDVSALDPDAARPFNLPVTSYSTSVIDARGELKMQTYLIDSNGNIEFPVLGTVKLGGLTRTQATSHLKKKLSEYIKDPIVNIRLANFTITVLGEVKNPGTFTIQDERISVSEALGLAGDLTNNGKRTNIFLIRENGGEKRFARLDLTSVNLVNSQLYYMAQNDVLIVEPNRARRNASTYNPNTAVIISAISTLATITAIFVVK